MAIGQLAPMFVVHAHDGTIIPVLATWDNKSGHYDVVKVICIAHDAIAICMICEGWIAGARTREELEGRPPSEREDRKEVVSVTMSMRQPRVRSLSSWREIIRDWDGKITGVGPELVPPGIQGVGRMFELLPEERPSRRDREWAKKLLAESGMGQPS
jgi:hypothetical protein